MVNLCASKTCTIPKKKKKKKGKIQPGFIQIQTLKCLNYFLVNGGAVLFIKKHIMHILIIL